MIFSSSNVSKGMHYTLPHFEEEDLYDPLIQHWINFFGAPALTDTHARIQYVLQINESAMHPDCGFAEEVHALLTWNVLTNHTSPQTKIEQHPREYFSEYLTTHMLRDDPSDHHIIFKNQHLNGHPLNQDNIINLPRGPHTSLHELLGQRNLYPHQQLLKLLTCEKDTLDHYFLEALQHVQNSYHQVFLKDPFSIYRPHCFHDVRRNKRVA